MRGSAIILCLMLLATGVQSIGKAGGGDQTEAGSTKPAQSEPASEPGEASLASVMTAPQVDFISENDIGLVARLHFATHTADFERSRAFYRELGYTEGVSGFPLTNTHQMARALGMFDLCQYELLKGEVIHLPGSAHPASIDLLQFRIPFDDSPPYERPNHLGAAYAAYATRDFSGDVAALEALGATLLAEPFGKPGSRFVFFRDPDGVLYKLVEKPDGQPVEEGMNIYDMPYVAINVSDLEASLAFYAMFGYTGVTPLAQTEGSIAEARAYGLDEPFQFKSADIALQRGDRHTLRLTQWIGPYNPEPPYPPPINRIGINRIALLVPDIDRAVTILKRRGVEFLSEPAPCCTGTVRDKTAIVHAIDPDGVFLELVGGITPRAVQPQPEWCPPLEIKYPPGAGPVAPESP